MGRTASNFALGFIALLANVFTITGAVYAIILAGGVGSPKEFAYNCSDSSSTCSGSPPLPFETGTTTCCVTDQHGLFLEPNATCTQAMGMQDAPNEVSFDVGGIEESALNLMKRDIAQSMCEVPITQVEMQDYSVIKDDLIGYQESVAFLAFTFDIEITDGIIYVQGGVPLGMPSARQSLSNIPIQISKRGSHDIEMKAQNSDGTKMTMPIAAVVTGFVEIRMTLLGIEYTVLLEFTEATMQAIGRFTADILLQEISLVSTDVDKEFGIRVANVGVDLGVEVAGSDLQLLAPESRTTATVTPAWPLPCASGPSANGIPGFIQLCPEQLIPIILDLDVIKDDIAVLITNETTMALNLQEVELVTQIGETITNETAYIPMSAAGCALIGGCEGKLFDILARAQKAAGTTITLIVLGCIFWALFCVGCVMRRAADSRGGRTDRGAGEKHGAQYFGKGGANLTNPAL